MKFEDYSISFELKKNLEKQGFRRPTDIQFKAIPPILKGEDVLAIAQTGTGKTAAFAIPVIHKIQVVKKTKRTNNIQCLVMVPTHELAQQITEVFTSLGKNTGVSKIIPATNRKAKLVRFEVSAKSTASEWTIGEQIAK